MRKGRVLVVDDSASVRRQVAAVLAAADDLEVVAECAEGLAALVAMTEAKPDVVLCDLEMPVCDGIQFLRLKAARPDLEAVPVIMLTSADDQHRKVDVLGRGAADYITKPFHDGELLARIRVHARIRALQEDLEAANQRLYELSCTDGLTGIFNRRHLDKVLETEVSRHHRYGISIAIILADIDHFKRINDEFGHVTGDSVLKRIALTLKGLVRSADIVARFGGEEICIVLAATGTAGALNLAERLRAATEALEHPRDEGAPVRATASFGIAAAEEKDPSLDVARLVSRADRALYAAKRAGRNRVASWTKELDETLALSPGRSGLDTKSE